MLPRHARLKSPRLFARLLSPQQSQRLGASPFFVVIGLPKEPPTEGGMPTFAEKQSLREGELPKFGLIVSKKVHKRANQRNRIKRRLREIIRTRLLLSPLPKLLRYQAVLIIAREGALRADFDELVQRLEACFVERPSPPDSERSRHNKKISQ